MALDDLNGITVARGTFLYDGSKPRRFHVVARDYDVRWSTYEADGLLEPGEQPAEPGPDGLYYYISATGPFRTLDEARDWAERAWGPVTWSRTVADIVGARHLQVMRRSIIALIGMLTAPVLLLLAAAHTGLFSSGEVVAYLVLIAAWAIGVVAIWSARWSHGVTISLTIAYTIAAIPVLPFVGLLAVCSTGDCI